jgi:hypothetical protein
VATTYTRIKNRRGLKIDLPQPLADGEIGLATDTRELYIGAGVQDLLNADVQVTPFLDAQSVIADDLGNLTSSSTNNGLLNFNVSGTEVVSPGANVALAYIGNYGLPTGHPKLSGGLVEADLVVTKFVNGIPTTYDASQYTLAFSGTTTYLNFTGSNVPEVGSSLIVSKWTKAQITDHIRERASWEASDNTIATYDKWQEGNASTNQVFVDVTTGTGFVQFVTSSEKTALLTANANDSINLIDEPTAIKPTSAYGTFLGENSVIHTPVREVEIDSNLKIDLDTPQQAYNISRFINKKRGNVSRVASNIEIFTEASYPRYQTNQYVGSMKTATLNNSGSGTVIEYLTTESNVYKIDYSLKLGANFRTGTIHITTDGTTTAINDTHVETGATSDVTFSAAISSAKLQFNYANANASDANLSYKIERWLQA